MTRENPISEGRAKRRGVPTSIGYLQFSAEPSRVSVAGFLAESPVLILMNPFSDAETSLSAVLGLENYREVELEGLDDAPRLIESHPAEMHAVVLRRAALKDAAGTSTEAPRLTRGTEGIESTLVRLAAPRTPVWVYASSHGSFEVFGPPDEIDAIADRIS